MEINISCLHSQLIFASSLLTHWPSASHGHEWVNSSACRSKRRSQDGLGMSSPGCLLHLGYITEGVEKDMYVCVSIFVLNVCVWEQPQLLFLHNCMFWGSWTWQIASNSLVSKGHYELSQKIKDLFRITKSSSNSRFYSGSPVKCLVILEYNHLITSAFPLWLKYC